MYKLPLIVFDSICLLDSSLSGIRNNNEIDYLSLASRVSLQKTLL